MKGLFHLMLLIALLSVLPIGASAQTNLLINSRADEGAISWRSSGKTSIEDQNGNSVFVIRDNCLANFSQKVGIGEKDAAKFALLIGKGSSERINPDGAITGLPHLYGYMLSSSSERGGTISDYLQGQAMLLNTKVADEWGTMYGIFPVPKGTVAIQFMLNQAERRGVPPNGSAARFDDLGLYLFDSREEALKFIETYK